MEAAAVGALRARLERIKELARDLAHISGPDTVAAGALAAAIAERADAVLVALKDTARRDTPAR
jgi:hypothetical protein